ncbi:MAG: FecR domain-containing protein [Sphingomonadales bacterium]|nr:FecR domain-containing protein [Sphingomonadales bacterium]MDE2170940.1 FecR domain-containing protein [Sphingomonadales bacterium]
MTAKQTIIDQAAQWHVASARDDMDWDGFTRWLEEAPDHRTCYDDIARADAMLQRNRDALLAAWAPGDTPRQPRRWGLWAGAGAAVAAMLTIALNLPATPRQTDIHYATGGGSRRIALADGSAIVLAPRSRLDLGDATGARMQLSGGAYFDIRHNPKRAMTIAAGPVELRDIGTRFDVQTNGQSVRIAVAQGQLSVASPELARSVPLTSGHALVYDQADGQAQVEPVDQRTVGTWRHGQLTYDDTPLTLVAQDLERYEGVHVDLPPDLLGRRFSGILTLGEGQKTASDLARLMGLDLVRGAGGRLSLRAR